MSCDRGTRRCTAYWCLDIFPAFSRGYSVVVPALYLVSSRNQRSDSLAERTDSTRSVCLTRPLWERGSPARSWPDLWSGCSHYVPLKKLKKGDHRGSSAVNSRPPAAKSAGKFSQSFHSLVKGDKGASPAQANVETPQGGFATLKNVQFPDSGVSPKPKRTRYDSPRLPRMVRLKGSAHRRLFACIRGLEIPVFPVVFFGVVRKSWPGREWTPMNANSKES